MVQVIMQLPLYVFYDEQIYLIQDEETDEDNTGERSKDDREIKAGRMG